MLIDAQEVFGICFISTDWPDEPCYGCPACYPGIEQEKSDWLPYYDFKGTEWMEAKKQEMMQAIQNNSLFEWIKETKDSGANKNVHRYYFLLGEAPNLDGEFVDEVFPKENPIPPPQKQIKYGVKLGHIICDKGKNPVWNVHLKSACINEDSEMELIKRGWAKLRLLLPVGPFPDREMELTGKNVMSYMLLGNYVVNDNVLDTSDKKKEAVRDYAQEYHPDKTFLEYSVTPDQYHYNVGDAIKFDLLEWGNYNDCWDLKIRIFNEHRFVVHHETPNLSCQKFDDPITFQTYSIGDDSEIICKYPGYYMIEVSNGKIFPSTIVQNFACLENES